MDLLQGFASAWCGTAEAGDIHLVSAKLLDGLSFPDGEELFVIHLPARWRFLGPTALLVLLVPNLSSIKE